jgi:hypothetical protein
MADLYSQRVRGLTDDPILNHFLLCSDELALDFIEALFRTTCGPEQ